MPAVLSRPEGYKRRRTGSRTDSPPIYIVLSSPKEIPSHHRTYVDLCSDSRDTQVQSPSNTTAQAQQHLEAAAQKLQDVELRVYKEFLQGYFASTLFLGQPIPQLSNLKKLGSGSFGEVMMHDEHPDYCFKIEVNSGKVRSAKHEEVAISRLLKGCTNIVAMMPVELHSGLLVLWAMPKFQMDLDRYNRVVKGPADMKIVKEVNEAIGYLLIKDLAHGDVKPANILLNLGPNGEIMKVAMADIGTLSSMLKVQQSGFGTPWYTGVVQILKEAQDSSKHNQPDNRVFELLHREDYMCADDIYASMVIAIEVALKIRVVPLPPDLYDYEWMDQYLMCTHIISKMLDPKRASNVVAGQLKLYLRRYTGGDEELVGIVEGQLSKVDRMLGNAAKRYELDCDYSKANALRLLRTKKPETFNSYLSKIRKAAPSNFASSDAKKYYCESVEVILNGIHSGTSPKEIMSQLKQL